MLLLSVSWLTRLDTGSKSFINNSFVGIFNMQKEIWRGVTGYEDYYEVSNLGNVKRLQKSAGTKGGLLKFYVNKGYALITLSKKGVQKDFSVHRIVCLSFIHNPENKPCVNHKDSNRLNNHLDNLEWCTFKENTEHAYLNKRFPIVNVKGEKNPRAKLTEKQVLEIRESKKSSKELAKMYNFNYKYFCKMRKGGSWKHLYTNH